MRATLGDRKTSTPRGCARTFRSGRFTSLAVAGAVWVGWSWAACCVARRQVPRAHVRVTAGYHRYFSHRTFKTSRVFQFMLALLGMSSRPARPAVVGRAPPQPPQALRRARGHPLAAAARLLVVAHAAGSSRAATTATRLRPDQGLRASTPSCAGSTARSVSSRSRWGFVLYLIGGSTALFWGLFVSL